jgi:hypothetical protein
MNNKALNIIDKTFNRLWRWLTATLPSRIILRAGGRRRKILSFILIVLMMLTTIRFLVVKPTVVRADSFIGLNEGYGSTVHDENGNVTGTITNAVWKDESMCKVGKCLYFDGTGDYVSFADNDNLDMAASDEVTIKSLVSEQEILVQEQELSSQNMKQPALTEATKST